MSTNDENIKSHREETGELIIVKAGQGLQANTSNLQSISAEKKSDKEVLNLNKNVPSINLNRTSRKCYYMFHWM